MFTKAVRFALLFALSITPAGCGTALWNATPIASSSTASAAEATALSAEANTAWAGRGDAGKVKLAIRKWEEALTKAPLKETILTALARAYYFYGDTHLRTAGDKNGMMKFFTKGVAMGERAMMAASAEFATRVEGGESVEDAVGSIPLSGQAAMYWYSVCIGKWANEKGFSTLLRYKDRIFKVMQRVLKLDPTYFYGAPHRYFGVYYAKAPGFAGGDMRKSEEHFKKALEIAPTHLGTKVLYAEFWALKENEEDLFRDLLNQVVKANAADLADIEAEQQFEQAKAKQLLENIVDSF
ncbi:MAG: TRAP transporter TatT component family protein [Myxococcota bacterium]|nr:TRAP transporter TatT component family protein [Myxococcota bacterium]